MFLLYYRANNILKMFPKSVVSNWKIILGELDPEGLFLVKNIQRQKYEGLEEFDVVKSLYRWMWQGM